MDGRKHTVPLRKPLQIFFLREGISSIIEYFLNFCHELSSCSKQKSLSPVRCYTPFRSCESMTCYLSSSLESLFRHIDSSFRLASVLAYHDPNRGRVHRLSFSRPLLGYKSMTARSNPQGHKSPYTVVPLAHVIKWEMSIWWLLVIFM